MQSQLHRLFSAEVKCSALHRLSIDSASNAIRYLYLSGHDIFYPWCPGGRGSLVLK
jgi:hypothetical protein